MRTFLLSAVITAAAIIAPISQAQAYSIHHNNGTYSVTCENGDRWTIGNGTTQISHEVAARICAKRGSSLTVGPDAGVNGGGVTGAKPAFGAMKSR